MKKGLLTLATLALTLVASAQSMKVAEQTVGRVTRKMAPKAYVQSPVRKSPVTKLESNQRYLGPYTTDEVAEDGLGLPSYPGTFEAATFIPAASVSNYFVGGRIVSIRFAVCEKDNNAGHVYVYTMKGKTITRVAQGSFTKAEAGWNTVTLDEPYTINPANFDQIGLGFTYTQTSSNNPLSVVATQPVYSSYVYGTFGQYGTGWQDIGISDYGNLSVQAIVENEYPTTDISLTGINTVMGSIISQLLPVDILVENSGSNALQSAQIGIAVGDEEIKTVDLGATAALAKDTISTYVHLPATLSAGANTVKAYVKSINGETPTQYLDGDTVSAPFKALRDSVSRQNHLVEQFTSTSCTYCPLGIDMISALSKSRGDVAWVASHSTQNRSYPDPMRTAQCDSLYSLSGADGFPSAAFDRLPLDGVLATGIGYGSQYTKAAANMFSSMFDETNEYNPAQVTLNVTALADTTDNTLKIHVVGAGVDEASTTLSDNRLFVYITEDSITARQLNQGNWISNFNHNGVLRKVVPSVFGNEITWTGDDFDMQFNVATDKSWKTNHLNVVAFVAPAWSEDTDVNHMAVNQALEVPFTVGSTTGINTVDTKTTSKVVARYNAAGQRINGAQRGLNIIKYADGKTVKVVVK